MSVMHRLQQLLYSVFSLKFRNILKIVFRVSGLFEEEKKKTSPASSPDDHSPRFSVKPSFVSGCWSCCGLTAIKLLIKSQSDWSCDRMLRFTIENLENKGRITLVLENYSESNF